MDSVERSWKFINIWISRNEKSFLDEIKKNFQNFWRAIIWWKNIKLIKNSGHKLSFCVTMVRFMYLIYHNSRPLVKYSTPFETCLKIPLESKSLIIFSFKKNILLKCNRTSKKNFLGNNRLPPCSTNKNTAAKQSYLHQISKSIIVILKRNSFKTYLDFEDSRSPIRG